MLEYENNLYNEGVTLIAGVENDYEHADNVISKLTLSGKPNETVSESGSKIGTITITVSPENYEN